jgi:hypothetical protein
VASIQRLTNSFSPPYHPLQILPSMSDPPEFLWLKVSSNSKHIFPYNDTLLFVNSPFFIGINRKRIITLLASRFLHLPWTSLIPSSLPKKSSRMIQKPNKRVHDLIKNNAVAEQSLKTTFFRFAQY